MKALKYYLGLLATVLFAHHASAYDLPTALANISDDYADCAVYYSLGLQMENSMNRARKAQDIEAAADRALKLYLTAMNDKSNDQLMSKSKLDLHFKINTKILKEEGMDRLILMYSDLCKSILENPNERMNYWLNKK